ncbi:MAG: hypothetical protein LBL18_06700, partial [Bacteroidales bacterium]|nr:hypothetical protein [Bacteroidales bacterium]
LLVCLGIAICTAGCVKQRNCDCGQTGTFIYLKEPYETNGSFCKSAKITAHFINDWRNVYYISGTIPKRFQVQDSIRVSICMKNSCPQQSRGVFIDMPKESVLKLKCIERE